MNKPKFDPSQPFQVIEKPKFDASKPFKPTMFGGEEKPKPPITKEDVRDLIREEIQKAFSTFKPPERVIEKTVVKELPKETILKETVKEIRNEDGLKEEIESLKKKLEQFSHLGGSGVLGIPKPYGQNGKVLTVESDKAKWKDSSGGGLTAGTYTVSNPVEDRTMDLSSLTLDELAAVVGTLISDLGGL